MFAVNGWFMLRGSHFTCTITLTYRCTHTRTIQDGVTADEVAEVHGHQAVCDELRKNVRADRRPLSKVSADADISFHRPNVKLVWLDRP